MKIFQMFKINAEEFRELVDTTMDPDRRSIFHVFLEILRNRFLTFHNSPGEALGQERELKSNLQSRSYFFCNGGLITPGTALMLCFTEKV
jgi:hypothetical protein